jgi:hypothetical protein
MSYKEKQTADYLEKIESAGSEFDALFKDIEEDMDLVLISTNEEGDPWFRVVDYEPFHDEDRKIVQMLRGETDYSWSDCGFDRRRSITGSDYDKIHRPGVKISDDAYMEQIKQFSQTVYGRDPIDQLPEVDVIE